MNSTDAGGAMATLETPTAANLKQCLAPLGQLLAHASDAYFAVDGDWRFIYVNRKAEELFDRPAHSLLGRVIWDQFPSLKSTPFEDIYRAAVAGKISGTVQGYWSPRQRWYEMHADPSADGVFVRFTDITARRRQEDDRQRALERERSLRHAAEQASLTKDEFLATLSHEMRTPLNAILGWSHLIRIADNRQEIETGLDVIERNARAQSKIIEDLLDMSRIISGKIRLDLQPVDLPSLVEAAVASLQPNATAKEIRLECVIEPLKDSLVRGDANRLQQILTNLLNNAIKFTPRGGRVQVMLQPADTQIQISVADTGEGICPKFLPHVFDRFRQADASTTRRHGGLGLGLAIVKQLVEMHGGAVHAYSDGIGRGATMVLNLPIAISDRRPVTESADGQTAAAAAPRETEWVNLGGLKVLVVDDEDDCRELLQRLLENAGASVVACTSASEALRRIAGDDFGLIVSDIGMPNEDGYSLIHKVRAALAGRCLDVPAVALTAYARKEDRVAALAAGYQIHVPKPIEPAELLASIARLVREGASTD